VLISLDLDILCVCETFWKNNESEIINGYTCYYKNRSVVHKNAKRGSGGVAIFVKNTLLKYYNVIILDITQDDIIWIKLESKLSQESDVCICCCYLPPKNHKTCQTVDCNVFFDTLAKQVYEYQSESVVILCGDFNARCGVLDDFIAGVDDDVSHRTVIDYVENEYGSTFIEFLIQCGMCMLNGRSNNNEFTCISNKGKSVVDYIVVPSEQMSMFLNFNVITMSALSDRGILPPTHIPDHSVLSVEIDIPIVTHPSNEQISSQNYTGSSLKYDVSNLPESFLEEINIAQKIQEIESASNVNQVYHIFCETLNTEMKDKLPVKKQPNRKNKKKAKYRKAKQYWNEDLNKQWVKTRKCEREWTKFKGNIEEKKRLKNIYSEERKVFDTMHRRFKRKHQTEMQNSLIDKYIHNPNSFWKDVGNAGVANERRNTIPWEVHTETEVITDIAEVLSQWEHDFSSIVQDVPDLYDEEHYRTVKETLDSNTVPLSNNIDSEPLNSPITFDEVMSAINHAKTGKSMGIDNIPTEVLKNRKSITLLHKIIERCFSIGQVPEDWQRGIIHPIPKCSSKDPRKPLNYRGITISSIPGKIYATVLNNRLTKWLEDHNVLSESQNGYRRDRSCLDHLYTLTSMIQARKSKHQSTFVCYVDAHKAFDSVNRNCLWYKLRQLGLKGQFLTAIQSFYNNVTSCVKVNDRTTNWFPIELGVKQGCPLSPTLFSLYINDLADELQDTNFGLYAGEHKISMLMFADDIAIISGSETGLQNQMNILQDWCTKWRIQLNIDKTKIVHYRGKAMAKSEYEFSYLGKQLDYVEKYKYLGLWLHEHLEWKYTVNELYQTANRSLNVLICRYYNLGGVSVDIFKKLFDSYVKPIMTYGSAIWGLNQYPNMKRLQLRAAKFILGIPRRCSNASSLGDLGWEPYTVLLKTEAVRYLCRLRNMDVSRFPKQIHLWTLSLSGKSWEKRMKKLTTDLDMDYVWHTELINSKETARVAAQNLAVFERGKWYQDMWNNTKLNYYRIHKRHFEPAVYTACLPRQQRSAMALLRSGCFPLAIETGRWTKPKTPVEHRVCPFCPGQVETEIHFLLQCSMYDDLLYNLEIKAKLVIPDYDNLPVLTKYSCIMESTDKNFIKYFGGILYKMYKRRSTLIGR
jgi:hypothetical protein